MRARTVAGAAACPREQSELVLEERAVTRKRSRTRSRPAAPSSTPGRDRATSSTSRAAAASGVVHQVAVAAVADGECAAPRAPAETPACASRASRIGARSKPSPASSRAPRGLSAAARPARRCPGRSRPVSSSTSVLVAGVVGHLLGSAPGLGRAAGRASPASTSWSAGCSALASRNASITSCGSSQRSSCTSWSRTAGRGPRRAGAPRGRQARLELEVARVERVDARGGRLPASRPAGPERRVVRDQRARSAAPAACARVERLVLGARRRRGGSARRRARRGRPRGRACPGSCSTTRSAAPCDPTAGALACLQPALPVLVLDRALAAAQPVLERGGHAPQLRIAEQHPPLHLQARAGGQRQQAAEQLRHRAGRPGGAHVQDAQPLQRVGRLLEPPPRPGRPRPARSRPAGAERPPSAGGRRPRRAA